MGEAGGVSNCRVARWLPPVEGKHDETGTEVIPAEAALYHVVHEDGDEVCPDGHTSLEYAQCSHCLPLMIRSTGI